MVEQKTPEQEAREHIDVLLAESGWVVQSRDEIFSRDKASLDIFWLRDDDLEDSANLPDPHLIAQEIAEDLRTALSQIEDILNDLDDSPAENADGSV